MGSNDLQRYAEEWAKLSQEYILLDKACTEAVNRKNTCASYLATKEERLKESVGRDVPQRLFQLSNSKEGFVSVVHRTDTTSQGYATITIIKPEIEK